MRIKHLAQEHNAVPQLGLKLRPLDLESSALSIRPSLSHNEIIILKSDNIVLMISFVIYNIRGNKYYILAKEGGAGKAGGSKIQCI